MNFLNRFNNNKLPIILQDEVSECGLACVAMVSCFFGHKINLFSLREMFNISLTGTTLLDLTNLCEKLSISSRVLRIEIGDIRFIRTPAILHWNMNHFVVLKKVINNKIIIHDPAIGLRKCSFDEVSRSFTGIVLEVEKEISFNPIISNKKLTLYTLVKQVRGVFSGFCVLVGLSIVIESLSLTLPLFIQFVTDVVIKLKDPHTLYILAMIFVVLIIMQAFTEYIRSHAVIFITNNLNEHLTSNIVKHILKLPLSFFEKRHKGDILSRFQSVKQIQSKFSVDAVNIFLDGIMVLISFSLMCLYSVKLSMIVFIALFLFVMIRYISYRQLNALNEGAMRAHASASSVFIETLHGMMTIKSYAKEHTRFNLWSNNYTNALNKDLNISKMNVGYNIFSKLLFGIEHIVIITIGANLIIINSFSTGMLVAFLAYRMQLVNRASSFVNGIFDYKLMSVHLSRLSDILLQEPENPERVSSVSNKIKGNIRIDNICFRYGTGTNYILKDISFTIKEGEKVAIIGSSGCGKTTLLKIIMGLLPPSKGNIFIDDMNIQDLGIRNYRNITSCVMQDDTLMSGSILENICFFDESVDIERVYNSANQAKIHEHILSLPMRYETLVGDMGSSLSGGQKQCILIARALYKKPKILFLDEATSHLDVDSEIIINRTLRSLSITQIVIAHRKETIEMADRIIDLEKIKENK